MHTATPTPPPDLQALPPGTALRHAETEAELRACWPVMQQLRPRLQSADELVARVLRMRADGYRLLAAWQGDVVLALGGYRVQENLVYGRFLYLDDLVTREAMRSQRWGARLIAATCAIAQELDCAAFVLDTALTNTAAQRFYARESLVNHATGFMRALPRNAAA